MIVNYSLACTTVFNRIAIAKNSMSRRIRRLQRVARLGKEAIADAHFVGLGLAEALPGLRATQSV